MTLTPDELEAAAEKYFIAAFDEGSKTARQVARDAYLAGALYGKKLGREEMLALLRDNFPKDSDGPYRCGAWFADWLEQQLAGEKK